MTLREELANELESARQGFHRLVESVPEAAYSCPSGNTAWTVGDLLYHITLGPPALRFEMWMIRRMPGLLGLALNPFISNLFNRINAMFTGRRKRINRQMLIKAYERGHAGLVSSLNRMRDEDFSRSVVYPPEFVSELAGDVSVERIFRYVHEHFEIHAGQIRASTALA
jgi:hypothetical protein